MTLDISANITLDAEWVDHILVTAFDGAYGACWYWANNLDDDGTEFEFLATSMPTDDGFDRFHQILLTPVGPDAESYERVVLNKARLSKAITEAHAWPGYIGDYIRRGIAENDPGEIDAEAADLIVQLAVFGEVVFG